VAYFALLLLTQSPVVSEFLAKFMVAYAILNILVQIGFSFIVEKNPRIVLESTIFLSALYIFFVISYFGGPTGFWFPLVYILIIGSFFYRKLWGFTSGVISILYVIAYSVIMSNLSINTAFVEALPIIFAILISIIGGYLLNNRVESIQQNENKLTKVADKLTTQQSQEHAVLTAIADGVYAVDMERNLVLLNKAAQGLVSWDEKDAIGIKCWTVMKLKNQDDISVCEKDCPAMKVWNTGEAVFRTDTCFANKKSHKKIQLSSSYAPIKDYSGKMVGAICVFRDITREKELERLRNEFVSTASHELRTPITATEGYLSIVTDSGMCKPDTKSVEFIGKARTTLLNMSKLIKNLLAVTKIEEGKLETTITNFSIHDLVVEVISVFKKQAETKGITLALSESKTLATGTKKAVGRSLNVRADQEMLREVVNNLIENAIKFTDKGGVNISIDYDDEFATVNIEDTGMGMPADAQKHLFEKFYRVDNTATREVGGTGLGLYITRSIIETFGGRIWVESTQGKGSTFHFTVPLALD